MKKTIFTIALFLMAFLSSDAQNNKYDYTEQQLFGKKSSTFKTPSNKKDNAAWKIVSGGLQTNISKFSQSDYLEIEIPKMDNIKENTSIIQRIIFNIDHQIKLSETVKAEIEVKLKGTEKWTLFEPITNDFIEITSNGGTAPKNLLNYANGKIFTKNGVKGGYNYDELYSLHVAGTDAKLKLADVSQIEKFRFRLVKTNKRVAEDTSFWKIETVSALNSKHAKKGQSGMKGSSETKNKSRLLANSKNGLGLMKIPFFVLVADFCCDGSCPEPHPH